MRLKALKRNGILRLPCQVFRIDVPCRGKFGRLLVVLPVYSRGANDCRCVGSETGEVGARREKPDHNVGAPVLPHAKKQGGRAPPPVILGERAPPPVISSLSPLSFSPSPPLNGTKKNSYCMLPAPGFVVSGFTSRIHSRSFIDFPGRSDAGLPAAPADRSCRHGKQSPAGGLSGIRRRRRRCRGSARSRRRTGS